MIIPYLHDMINDNKTAQSGEWKIQLNMHVNFTSSKDTGETRTIYVWSDNEEIRLDNATDYTINKLLKPLLDNYQKKKEQKMRGGSNFIFESVDLLYYSLHKIGLKRGESYIKSPEWLINTRATINPKNNDDNCFRYAKTVALNYQNIGNKLERISKNKPFINQYNWKDIDIKEHQKDRKKLTDWKKFEEEDLKNLKTIDWKSLNKIIRQLLLISYLYHIIQNQ